MQLTWLGHAGIKLIGNEKTIYIDPVVDPFVLNSCKKADLILVSTADFDHFSIECVRGLIGDFGVICGTPEAAAVMHELHYLRPYNVQDFGFCKIKIIPTKPWGVNRKNTILGFLINIENKIVYYPSDTHYVYDMEMLKPDVILLPVGGTFSATAKDAAAWLEKIRPRLIIPIHWGKHDGTVDNANDLIQYAPPAFQNNIRVLKENETIDVDEILKTL